ncbi:hypothetical protein [Cytobacillus luteolus]|uniref:hypothetical protein n=1 Tax=Litchfieldia luteola TaxID=682179 RepID=UPI001CAC6F06|nr:hypothetical protein [Cytobacillus luteolus]MBP1942754.1 hypothetical protein [Cytobacillus luteolus]
MGFEEEYLAFLNTHLQARTGERLRRLQEGHQQAEMLFLKQVWWPFTNLSIFILNMKLMISRMARGIWILLIFVLVSGFA